MLIKMNPTFSKTTILPPYLFIITQKCYESLFERQILEKKWCEKTLSHIFKITGVEEKGRKKHYEQYLN